MFFLRKPPPIWKIFRLDFDRISGSKWVQKKTCCVPRKTFWCFFLDIWDMRESFMTTWLRICNTNSIRQIRVVYFSKSSLGGVFSNDPRRGYRLHWYTSFFVKKKLNLVGTKFTFEKWTMDFNFKSNKYDILLDRSIAWKYNFATPST